MVENRAEMGRTFWRDVALYAGVWTLLGLFATTQSLVTQAFTGQRPDWGGTLGSQLINWYTCGIGTPLYVWLVRRFPLTGPRVALRVVLYFVVMIACVPLKYVMWVPLENALFHSHWSFASALVPDFFGVFLDQLYFVVLLYAVEYYRTARERELRASQLEAELSQAQLETLRTQLHPHFLFNTLNSISALMQRDVRAADEMLARLSDMLRLTLDSGHEQEVTLRKELSGLDLYLDIMRVRFRDRLTTRIDVPEALLDERVPSFVLQPLVENAVRHGIGESSTMTNIRISARAAGDALELRIVDDGRGIPRGGALREGFGLRNTRRRLERLYGQAGTLVVSARDGGGTEVAICLPRRARPGPSPPPAVSIARMGAGTPA